MLTRLAADLMQAVAASLQDVELLLLVVCHVGSEGLTCDQNASQQSHSCHLQDLIARSARKQDQCIQMSEMQWWNIKYYQII